jgi:hypothetical protein
MLLGLRQYRNNMKFLLRILIIFCLLSSCNFLQRNNLDDNDLLYIKNLGLLDESEDVLWFDSQLSIKKSGNFLSNKRMASYFLGENEQNNFKKSAYLNEIDSIKLFNNSGSISYSSYIQVFKKGEEPFKVYIDKDSSKVEEYYNQALKMLK